MPVTADFLRFVRTAAPIAFASLVMLAAVSAVADPLPEDVRARLAESVDSSTLEPWQREVMTALAEGRSLNGPARSSEITTTGEDGWWDVQPPASRMDHTAVYDPVRRRMIVFGGNANVWPSGGLTNDVWTLTLGDSAIWSPMTAAGTLPSGRSSHTAIYDPRRDRMVVFAGSGTGGNHTYELSLSGVPTWSNLAPAGTPPVSTQQHTAIYDPARDRMLVFSGVSLGTDVWELSLGGGPVWTKLTPTGTPPVARISHTAVYDPVRDRMIVFGGYAGGARNDLWSLILTTNPPTWSALTVTGTAPSVRYNHSAAYDSLNDRMVVYGGLNSSSAPDSGVWALSLAGTPAWTHLAFAGTQPNPRSGHSAIIDVPGQRMLVFGGSASNGGLPYHRDVAALTLSGTPAWTQVTPIWTPPLERGYTPAVYDSVHARLLLFSGRRSGGIATNDIWSLTLTGRPAWARLVTTGVPPNPRGYHAAIYDSKRDRLVVFGGYDFTNSVSRNDVWALTLSGTPTWSQLLPSGTLPVARWYSRAVYDAIRDRMIMFGGYDSGASFGDSWALNFTGTPAWQPLSFTGATPAARYGHSLVLDTRHDRVLLHGGFTASGVAPGDTWALALAGASTWTPLTASGSPPSWLIQHCAVYDSRRDRMVVRSTQSDSTWALALTGTPAWTALAPTGTPVTPIGGESAIYDPLGDRMVVLGEHDGTQYVGVRFLHWGPAVEAADPLDRGPRVLAPLRFAPNPAIRRTKVSFELPSAGHTRLAVFDVSGRCVRLLAEGWSPAGRTSVAWDAKDANGADVAAGAYFVRLEVERAARTGRVIIVR